MISTSGYLLFLLLLLGVSLVLIFLWARRYLWPRIEQRSALLQTVSPQLPPPIQSPSLLAIPRKLEIGLALGAIILYLAVRLIGLDRFPIYFFADEAVQTVLAEELVLKDYRIDEELFPTFFYNVDKYSLSVSVYLQVLPYLIWGKSILVTRGVAVLVATVGVIAIYLILKRIFGSQHGWLGILILSVTPAWFLHSRTAFETVLATAFYALFLYAYLLYLYRSPKFWYVAILAGALTFYAYSPARLVILSTAGLLLLSDWRYHWQNRRMLVLGGLFAGVLILPYLRFQYYHPFEEWQHLVLLNSYWTENISLGRKFLNFGREYVSGLNIAYWYLPKTQDIVRHVMKGYGHFLWIFFPFLLVGLWLAVRNWRVPAYRVVLIALICAPTGGALFENSVTRALMMVVPVTLLTTLGMIKILSFPRIFRERQAWLSMVLFTLFCGGNLLMLSDALKNGPYWFDDYGLYGMQYGGEQVFSAVDQFQIENPDTYVVGSYRWLNGGDMVMRFFVHRPEMFYWGVLGELDEQDLPLDEDILFVVTAAEWKTVTEQNPLDFEILKIIPYPDESPGFYFVKRRK